MKATEVTYAAKRVTRQYENDTATITIQLGDGEDIQAAFAMARVACDEALNTGQAAGMAAKMKDLLATAEGRRAFDLFLKSQGK